MPTAFDTPIYPFGESFADLPKQWLEASTRAIRASAEIYTEVLNTQAEATRALLEAYSGLAAQTARSGGAETAEKAEKAAETATEAARTTARSTQRTTRRAAGTTRRAAGTTRRAADATRRAADATRRATESARAAATPQPPIAGYDGLTIEEVVAKLPEQPQAALAEIAAYEGAKEKRATVLQRIAALTGPEPAPGYDTLSAEDAVTLVTNGSPTLAAAVGDYERRHKHRASVVEAATRRVDANADTDADAS
jgi:hypothetical protein